STSVLSCPGLLSSIFWVRVIYCPIPFRWKFEVGRWTLDVSRQSQRQTDPFVLPPKAQTSNVQRSTSNVQRVDPFILRSSVFHLPSSIFWVRVIYCPIHFRWKFEGGRWKLDVSRQS